MKKWKPMPVVAPCAYCIASRLYLVTIYQTIDAKLQKAATQALGNESGAIVVVAPNTGEVLALVSNPTFDPNLFVTKINRRSINSC